MNDLYSIDFMDTLPPSLKADSNFSVIARILADELSITAQMIPSCLIYARIDELPETILDILAYDLHVDWYDYSYPIETKRNVIKDSIKVHKRLGTKYAVETAVGNVYAGSKVSEWFEYGGDPYCFRIDLDCSSTGLTAETYSKIIKNVNYYKNARSKLETVNCNLKRTAPVNTGVCCTAGIAVIIRPYTAGSVSVQAEITTGGAVIYANSTIVKPKEGNES